MTSYDIGLILEKIKWVGILARIVCIFLLICFILSIIWFVINAIAPHFIPDFRPPSFAMKTLMAVSMIMIFVDIPLISVAQDTKVFLEFKTLQEENNVKIFHNEAPIDITAAEKLNIDSNGWCKYSFTRMDFQEKNGIIYITSDNKEVEKLLDSCTETSSTEQPVSSISN